MELNYAHMPAYQAFEPDFRLRARKLRELLVPYQGKSLLVVQCQMQSDEVSLQKFAVVPGIVKDLRNYDDGKLVSVVDTIESVQDRNNLKKQLKEKGIEGRIVFLR